jgi:hypothetical protein
MTRRRSLFLEALEARELFAVDLRIADYNIAGDARSGMATILRALGDEVVNGTSRPIDVLALEETDSQATDTQAVVNLLNGIYGAGVYARGNVNGSSTGAGTQGVVYRTSTIQLMGETALSAAGTERAPMRYQLRPVGFGTTNDFYLYVAHPKASDTSADADERNVEAQTVRADMDALPQGTNIVYAADTNFYRSSEPGWATFTAAGNGQLFDPINQVGNWNNNSSFAPYHTQSPTTTARYAGQVTGGMDDRFDMQLVSNELTNGAGLDIIPSSYHALGNNGSTFNTDIDSAGNTWVWNPVGGSTVTRSALLTALASVSDHLPVVADYTIASGTTPSTTTLTSSANPSVYGQPVTFTATVTGGSGTPTGSVSFLDGAGLLGTSALNGSGVATFTTSTLIVGAGHTISAQYGGNGTYAAGTSNTVNQQLQLGPTTTAVTSTANPSTSGQSVTFTATVTATPPSTGTPDTAQVTFKDGATVIGTANSSNGVATLTTLSLSVGTHSITATYTGSNKYAPSTSGVLSQMVNGTAGTLQFAAATAAVAEGQGVVTLTVTRAGGSSGAVTVQYATADGTALAGSDYTPTSGTLTWANGDATPRTISVPVVDNGSGEPDETFTVTLSGPGGAALGSPASATVTITDPVLAVTAATATDSGVLVTFNRGFGTAPLNLYTDLGGTLGSPDLTVVGNTVGAVRGSLVVLPGNQAYFVKTGGVLAADTYTLTVVGGTGAFADLGGVAGTSATRTVTAAASSAVVLSLPDFARGGGQTDGPNNPFAAGLPLALSTGAGVTSAHVEFSYDPALLTPTGATTPLPGFAVSNFTANAANPPAGMRVVSFDLSGPALAAGAVTLANVQYTIPAAAPYATKEALRFRNLSLNGGAVAVRGDDAVHVAAFAGDADGNKALGANDASLELRVATAAAGTGFLMYPVLDPVVLADADGSGTLSANDASLILQKAVGFTVNQLPNVPAVAPPTGGPDPALFLGTALAADGRQADLGALTPGQVVYLPVSVTATEPGGATVAGADVAVRFDPRVFRFDGVTAGAVAGGFAITAAETAPGMVHVSGSSAAGTFLAYHQTATVYLIRLTVRPSAAAGATPLNLLAADGTFRTALFDTGRQSLTLGPAPTNAAADAVDATAVVLARRPWHPARPPVIGGRHAATDPGPRWFAAADDLVPHAGRSHGREA